MLPYNLFCGGKQPSIIIVQSNNFIPASKIKINGNRKSLWIKYQLLKKNFWLKWTQNKKIFTKRKVPGVRTASNYQFFGVMLTVCDCVITAALPLMNRTGEPNLFFISVPVQFSLQSLTNTCIKYLDGSDIDETCIKSGVFSVATGNQILKGTVVQIGKGLINDHLRL